MDAVVVLARAAKAGLVVEARDGSLVVRPRDRITDELRAQFIATKADLLALLTHRPHRLSAAEADVAHSQPWDDAQIARFTQRVVLFVRRGIGPGDADDLAERLHLRDLQGDAWVTCIECRHLKGGACGNWGAAGLGSDAIGPDLSVLPQRCPGFGDQS